MQQLERLEDEDSGRFGALLMQFQGEIGKIGFGGTNFQDLVAYIKLLRSEHYQLEMDN